MCTYKNIQNLTRLQVLCHMVGLGNLFDLCKFAAGASEKCKINYIQKSNNVMSFLMTWVFIDNPTLGQMTNDNMLSD